MENLKMHTPNRADENYQKLAALFPNAVTETIDPVTGEVVRAIDKDVLMQEISATVVDGHEERYQFTWPDKKKAILLANSPISKTLRPCREESVDFDNTENLYIEGDNLEVLKLLQETYLGKVKMIYIDPPYNTGNDFVYEDDFAESTEEYLAHSGQYDEDGNRLFKNMDTNGRFHTDWLNMMYPRLRLAKDLLTEDGVIFISIDDHEQENLKKICGEVFGESNFIATFCWKTDGNFDNQARIKVCHQYIMCYAKNESLVPAPPTIDPSIPKDSKLNNPFIRNTIIKNGVKNPISDVEIPEGFPCDFDEGIVHKVDVSWPKYSADISVKNGVVRKSITATTGWSSKAQLVEFIKNGFNPIIDSKGQVTRFVLTKTGAIEGIKERKENNSHVISVLQGFGGSQKATSDMDTLGKYFDYPKPILLIEYLIKMAGFEKDAIILDFFGGSATTAHAVMKLNAEDGGYRNFIIVQLPETTDNKPEAQQAGYKTICEIGKERIRRAGEKIKSDNPLTTQNLDTGFRVLKLDSSNMKDVYYTPSEMTMETLMGTIDNIKEDRTPEDLLFQVMLDLGVLLSSKIEESTIDGRKVFNVADGFLIACFDENVTEETIKAIAKQKPYYFVMRDSSMASDSVAVNFEQIFETYSPDTVRRVI